jgi:hypothetical protein
MIQTILLAMSAATTLVLAQEQEPAGISIRVEKLTDPTDPTQRDTVAVITTGKKLTENQAKAYETATHLADALIACVDPNGEGHPTATPPSPPLGGTDDNGDHDPKEQLDDLLENDRVGYDETLKTGRPGIPPVNGVAAPEDKDAPVGPAYHHVIEGAPGMNLGDIIPKGYPESGQQPGRDAGLPGYAPAGPFEPGEEGCEFSVGQMIELISTILHELNHINEDPAGSGAEAECPIYYAQVRFWCEVLDCLQNGGDLGPATTFFGHSNAGAPERICAHIEDLNWKLKRYQCDPLECPACPNNGIPVCPETGDPDNDGHPDNGGGGQEGAPAPGVPCGWNVNLRFGYYHMHERFTLSSGEYLDASIDQTTRETQIELFGFDFGGSYSETFDGDAFEIGPTDGTFIPVSVATTSDRSLLLAGYASLSGKGVIIRKKYAPASLVQVGGAGQPGVIASAPELLYVGCDFTYIVALDHARDATLAYFFDRDQQSLGAVDLISGAVVKITDSVEHPHLAGTLSLLASRYRDNNGVLRGPEIWASRHPVDVSGFGLGAINEAFYLMADRDGNKRFDSFDWIEPF